jgi:hypothetical protein
MLKAKLATSISADTKAGIMACDAGKIKLVIREYSSTNLATKD